MRSDDVTRWRLAGAAACEDLDDLLGDGPWTSDDYRVHDGSAAAMLAAVWLGVIAPDHRGVARHPTRGAVGEGDDALSAALFVLLAVERVQASRGVLRVLPGIAQARGLPTPYGLIDIDGDTVTGTWRGQPPTIVHGG